MKYLGIQATLDRVPDQARCVGPVELVDGDNAGRRGDVDFREPAATDHVDPDKQKPAPLELGTKRGANLLLRFRQLSRFRRASGGKIGSDISFGRPAIDRAGELAVDEDDPFVAIGHFGKEQLKDMRLAIASV